MQPDFSDRIGKSTGFENILDYKDSMDSIAKEINSVESSAEQTMDLGKRLLNLINGDLS